MNYVVFSTGGKVPAVTTCIDKVHAPNRDDIVRKEIIDHYNKQEEVYMHWDCSNDFKTKT